MKHVLIILALLITSAIAHADEEFRFSPKLTVGAGLALSLSGEQPVYVAAKVYTFEFADSDGQGINLLGVGATYQTDHDVNWVISPLAFKFSPHLGFGMDWGPHLIGGSLLYRF